jgi:hypothetical protein
MYQLLQINSNFEATYPLVLGKNTTRVMSSWKIELTESSAVMLPPLDKLQGIAWVETAVNCRMCLKDSLL